MLSRDGTRRHEGEAGFTLMEVLVVMVIMAIIGGFTASSLIQGLQVSNDADRRIQTLTDLQQAGQRVSRELRMACSVQSAAPDEVVIDLLRDNASGVQTRYRYAISADADGVLTADVDVVAADGVTTTDHRTDRLAEDIANGGTLFTYFDADNAPTAVLSQVRNITLTLRRDASDDTVEWTGDLHLRNGGLSCGF